jgi:hypothetical protein
MYNELENFWKEAPMAEASYYSGICLEGTWGQPPESSLNVTGVQPEIWIERLPYKSLEHYRYANRPG